MNDQSPRRRFTLADIVILIAASAVVAWVSRFQSRFTVWPMPGGGFSALPSIGMAQLWLASWIMGLLVCAIVSHVRGPRLPHGNRYRRPDWLVVSLLMLVLIYVGSVVTLIIFE